MGWGLQFGEIHIDMFLYDTHGSDEVLVKADTCLTIFSDFPTCFLF